MLKVKPPLLDSTSTTRHAPDEPLSIVRGVVDFFLVHRRSIMLSALAGLVLGGLAVARTPPQYTATSTLLIDDNKVRAAVHGMGGELVDFARGHHVAARDLAERLLGELEPNAAALGCGAELERVRTIVEEGTGATRQVAFLAEHGNDLKELVRAEVALTA